MMVSGRLDRSKGMEFGKVSMVTHTLDNGSVVKLRDMESTLGLMETDMRVNGKSA